jgi:hexosaminidase
MTTSLRPVALRCCARGLAAIATVFMATSTSAQDQAAREKTATRIHYLMPVPQSLEWQPGRLAIPPTFSAALSGASDSRLVAALDRAMRRLEGRLGFALPRELVTTPSEATFLVEVQAAAMPLPSLGDDESYALEVGPQQVVLRAATSVGALRGIETLLQLVSGDGQGWYVPAVRIVDRPRFPWRGLMIDVCRHWIPADVVKRNIDSMVALKLNVLHLHLTEDQGFRIESKRYPRLQQFGSDGLYYTQDQMRELITYAGDRGIRIVPEFDMPGHATSWLVGHPELGSAPGPYSIERKFGIFDPTIDPTREDVYKFLDGFLGEMAALFPDPFMHIGGDENNGKQWDANQAIQAFKQKRGIPDNHGLQAYFNQRLSKILQKHGKKMVGWDEILHPDLPRDIVVQSWRGQKSLAEGARLGYRGLLSNGYYIDLTEPASRHYLVDPLPKDAGLSEEQAARVLGGEATMWSEFVGVETIDSRIWPRLAAIAERLWSPREINDVGDMYRRLDRVSVQLEELGLTHLKNVDLLTRRLANGGDVEALDVLVSLVEPVEGYQRSRQYEQALGERPTQATPLTRLVDVAQADSRLGLRVAMLVDALLDDAPRFDRGRSELLEMFATWNDAAGKLGPLVERAPALHEARSLVPALRTLSDTGQTALAWMRQQGTPPQEWTDQSLATIATAVQPVAQVEFPIADALRRLIVAASMAGQTASMAPDEWKRAVVERATVKAPPPTK